MNKTLSFLFTALVFWGTGMSNACAATPSAPIITVQPVDMTVTAPAKATFTVVANGAPKPTYQWMQSTDGVTFTNITGATKRSYTIAVTTVADNGIQYECAVSNIAGSVTTTAATLTVNPTPIAPSITTQPVNVTVTAPATATFTVVATGTPAPTYQWMQSVDGVTFTNITGATSASYTTPATVAGSVGLYECVVSNAAGSVMSNIVTLTVNLPPLPVVTITSPANNSTLASGSNMTITASASETNGTISSVSFYNGTTLLGTSATSPYSYTVTNVSVGSYTLTATATDANGASTTSAPITVTVSILPVVTITGPVNNSTLTAGSNLTITASANENGGTISSVSFYNGTTLLGTSTVSPYSYTATNLPVGIYSLTATAKDVRSVSATSAPVTVTVTGQPIVAIASPVNNSTFTTGSVNITAIASENDGTISSVAFYNGTTLLGTVNSTSQAFTYTWTSVPSGAFNLTAVATDIIGTTATSSPVSVTINSTPFTYAIDDNISTKTDALNHTTGYQYDNLNRLLKTTFADGSTVSFAYDLFGNQTSVTDQRGNTLSKTYDAYERLVQTKDPLGGITQFNYDTNGDLLDLTDANGNATTYTYDSDYRVLTQTNALNFSIAFSYDPVGNVSSRTDANGKATNYTYDPLNRLTDTAYPDGTSVANVYDALGRRSSMTDATGQTTYSYDALSRLLIKRAPGNTFITYTYDGEGDRLSTVDQNNRPIAYTYDALNRLATVTAPNGLTRFSPNLTTTYGYDAVSNKIAVTNPNGVTESYTYDVLNRVVSEVNALGSTVMSSFSNVYDIAGMITKKTYQDGSWTAYSYDALNRLLEETKQTSSSIVYDYVYTYDPVGNRLTWTKNTTLGGFWNVDYLNMPSQVLTNMTNAGYGSTANPAQAVNLVRSYSYDAANRLSNWNYVSNIYSVSFPIQTDTYTYDNNGNRLTKQAVLTGQEGAPQQTSYTYDFENRLLDMSLPNVSVGSPNALAFTYNAEGLRVASNLNGTSLNYLYDGSNVVMESNSSGFTKSYNRGLDDGGGIGSLIDQNYTSNNTGVTQYYDYNDLGSVSNLTSTTGTIAASYGYDAFGNLLTPQTSTDTNRYLFSTKEFDSRSGLDYFGSRYYDPEIGRWLTPDPLGMVDGPNTYLYVNNNPVNWIDPYGLQEFIGPEDIIDEGGGDSTGTSDQVGNGGQEPCKGGLERSPQPPTEYRYDTSPSKPHFDKDTGQYEPDHWHYRDYNWNPKTQKWQPGNWKYGGKGMPPGFI